MRTPLTTPLLAAALAGGAAAQDTPPADATEPAPAQALETAPAPEPAPAKPPLGWLSDPDTPATDFFEALVSGKIHLDNRFRIEFADTTGRKSSTAITNRIRLGYETKAFHGFSGLVEMENVATPDEGAYFVPATDQGDADRTPIAEATGTEINRAWARFRSDALAGSPLSFDLKGGRQRIKLDDDRFIGNVGWRQFEQTFDSARLVSDLGLPGLTAQYAYVWKVQRIFGPDGPNWKSDSHLVNVSYAAAPEIRITPFVYLLDFRDDAPRDSVNNFGVRLTGALWRDADDEADLSFDYEFTYAYQTDAGANPVDYEAHFIAAQARLNKAGLGRIAIGYQLLGSDNGVSGFRFPLGTNHKFQGFADVFVVTPDVGLQDLYVRGDLELPFGISAAAIFHQFWSDEGSTDLGYEIDFVASTNITPIWSVLVKAAYFDGHNGQPDTSRLWLETTVRF